MIYSIETWYNKNYLACKKPMLNSIRMWCGDDTCKEEEKKKDNTTPGIL